MNNIYGIKDSANVTVKYKGGEKSGKVCIYSDYAKSAVNEWTSEQVYAKSKNVNAIRWDYGRASTLKLDMEIFDLKWVGLLAGSEFVTGSKNVLKREAVTVSNGTATLEGTPVSGSTSAFKLASDGISNEIELELSTESTVATGKYKIADKAVTVSKTDFPDGSKIAVFYMEAKTTAQTLVIKADAFPANFEVFGDSMIRNTDGVDQFVQMHYFNVKPKSSFTLTFDAENITTLSVEFDILKDSGSSDMAEYSIY